MEEIRSSLHSLEGNKIGEKLKNLNKLISYINESGHTESVHEIIDSYEPQNEFEKLVKLRLIDTFEYAPGVFKIIQSGDMFYIPWILKFKWFFSDKHGLLSNIENFDDFLPFLSYSVRLKVLKKYSLHLANPTKGEALYKLLKRKYGLKLALLVLPACSEDFVRNILFSSDFQIPSDISLRIFEVYPDVFVQYLKHLLRQLKDKKNSSTIDFGSYDEVIRKLASKNVTEFVKLLEEFSDTMHCFHVGRHVAKRIIKADVNSIFKFSNQYGDILKIKHISRMMKIEQIEILHKHMLPESFAEFRKCMKCYGNPVHFQLIKKLKPPIREQILAKNFQDVYGQNILDISEDWPDHFAKILPSKCRENWAEFKINEDYKNQVNFIPFLPTKKALPKLKDLMKAESGIHQRADIMNSMFKTLKLNGDFEELYALCDFAVKKHRNDNVSVRGNVLKGLTKFDLWKLPTNAWEPIMELINIFTINNEVDSYRPDILNVLCKWVHHRLTNNLRADEQLNMVLNTIKNNFNFVIAKGTAFEKQCLIWFIDNFNKRSFTKESARQVLIVELFMAMCKWNNLHKKDKISHPDWILSEIETVLVSDDCHYWKSQILSILKTDKVLRRKMFDRIFPRYYDSQVLTYKLHQDPVQILSNLEAVMNYLFTQQLLPFTPFFKDIKLSLWTGISEKVVSVCREGVKRSFSREKQNSIFILSLLLSVEDFIEFLAPYYPVKPVIKDYSNEGQNNFTVQSAIAANLKNVTIPTKALVPLKKFAVGDYLKLVVGSLESIFLRTPENIILATLKEWLDCPVSLRKHLVRSYCKIAPVELASSFLMNLFKMEKNISLRIIYFKQVYSIFKSEPNPGTWSVMKSIIDKVQSGDGKVLEILFDVSVVPQEFISEYIISLWDLVQKLDLEVKQKTDYEIKVIEIIDPARINFIPDNFCDSLISLLYTNENYEYQICLNTFVVYSLLYCNEREKQLSRFKRIKQAISSLVKSQWNMVNVEGGVVCQARELLESLVLTFVKVSCTEKFFTLTPLDLIKELRAFLLSILDETKMFEGFIYLNAAVIYHESKQIGEGQHFVHFIALLGKLIDEYCSLYGGEVAQLFVDTINSMVLWFNGTSYIEKYLRVCEILLENTSSKHCHIVAVKLLPDNPSELEKYTNELKKILGIIDKLTDPCVRIFVNKYYMTLHQYKNY